MLISICDDDETVLSQLRDQVSFFFREREIKYSMECYSNPCDFLISAQAFPPDAAFIDLAIGDADGFGLAEKLRGISVGTEIVFITSYVYRMPSAFPYKPVAFIEKPISRESLETALKTILFYQWHNGITYLLRIKGEEQRIPHKSIEYFESAKHQVLVHTAGADEPVSFPGKLDDVEAELKGLPYVRCHKSFIVQLDAIRSLERSVPCFLTNSGGRVPISRRYYIQAVQEFLQRKLHM